MDQKEISKFINAICQDKERDKKNQYNSAIRFIMVKNGPEKATKTRHYDLLWPRMGQKESPTFGSTIHYGQERTRKSQQESVVRFVSAKSGPEGATKIR